jgi:hypothetical protein
MVTNAPADILLSILSNGPILQFSSPVLEPSGKESQEEQEQKQEES